MFGRSAKIAILLLPLFFCCPDQAFAKRQNFVSGFPAGIGIVGGLEDRPRTDFAAGTQHAASNYSRYFAVQPYLDLVNVAFRLSFGWHFYPVVNGAGTNSFGDFSENSDGGSFDYGARVMLAPFLSPTLNHRVYFMLGVGQSIVKLKNTRNYSSGTLLGQTKTERVEGTGLEMNAGLGIEFFLLQNYSLQLEGGYVQRSVDSFQYKSSTDLTGTNRTDGEEVLNSSENKKGFHVWSPYAQIVLNLNL